MIPDFFQQYRNLMATGKHNPELKENVIKKKFKKTELLTVFKTENVRLIGFTYIK
jgi:hypothetical protein